MSKELRIPSSAFQDVDSFVVMKNDPEAVKRANSLYLQNENKLISQAQQVLDGNTTNYFSLFEVDGRATPENARKAATVEAAAIVLNDPRILTMAQEFTSLYRLLRTAELAHGFKRGGNSLLVGSGITVPEVMALYLEPPSAELIDRVARFDSKEGLGVLLRQEQTQVPSYKYKSGDVMAVEPNTEFVEYGVRMLEAFDVPFAKVFVVNNPIQDVLRDRISFQTDTVLWNRAEPAIFASPTENISRFAKRKERREAQRTTGKLRERAIQYVFGSLVEYIARNGNIMVTVGGGDDEKRLLERLVFIQEIGRLALQEGLEITPELSRVFEGTQDERYFGKREYGAVAALVAKK